MTVKLLGVCGRKRHGKDTVGEFLWQDFGFTPIGFADPIKRICMDIYGLSYDQCFGTETDKETIDERWGLTPRYIMQKVGTEMGREVHKDTWVRYCFDKINMASRGEHVLIHIPERRGFFPASESGRDLTRWVITDVRYPEEADSVRAHGGKVIKVFRPDLIEAYQDQHASETNIDRIEEDLFITNNSTLAFLRDRVALFVGGIL